MVLNTKEFEDKMKKSLAAYESELGTVSAGRANPQVLDKITVDKNGSPTQNNQFAE